MTMLDVFEPAPVEGFEALRSQYAAEFDEAWSLHPLKKDRKRAVASYGRARQVTTHELIMLRVRLYASDVRHGEVASVASLSSFLERVDWNPTPRRVGRR